MNEARLLVTGGTGNSGLQVLKRVRQAQPKRDMLALVRHSTNVEPLRQLGIPHLKCDLEQPATYIHDVEQGDVLLEMANLRYARSMLPVLASRGMKRAFCVTTTAVFSRHHSFSALYREIEQEMRNSPVVVTILRPSMIYGNERDVNMHKLLMFIDRWGVYPVFGSGKALMQPVYFDDLAEGVASAVLRNAQGEFNFAGPEALTYNEVIFEAFAALGKTPRKLYLPVAPIAALVRALEKVPGFPLRSEQVVRLQEDKVFDVSAAREGLGYSPRSFQEGIRTEVAQLRRVGVLA